MRHEAIIAASAVLLVAGLAAWSFAAGPSTIESPGADLAPGGQHRRALADAPDGLTRNGTYVRSEISPSGTIHVTQWIRSSSGIVQLRLSPYPDSGASTASNARLVDGSGREQVAPGPVGADPWTVTFLPPAHAVEVSYDLEGTVAESASAPGRALADPTSLELAYDVAGAAPTSRTVEVTGVQVLNVACEPPRTDTPRPCGRPVGDAWSTTLSGEDLDDLVIAQLDLSSADSRTSAAR